MSFISTGFPRYQEYPPYNIVDPYRNTSKAGSSSAVGVVRNDNVNPVDANGNVPACFQALQNGEEGDEEGLAGEDDDSAGLIVKDETDSAEEEAESEDELTDSASETEVKMGNDNVKDKRKRSCKPVITISDQHSPRMVIDFGEDEVLATTKDYTAHQKDSKLFLNHSKDEGIDDKSAENSNSIQESSNIPIQNWVESAQRHNKRKRTDSEVLEEKS